MIEESESPTLPEWVQVGAKFRLDKRTFHVRGIVDGRAVLSEWRPSKKRWNYTVETVYFFIYSEADITIIKRA